MHKLDVTIVSGSRPELLSRTLASSKKYIFDEIKVGNVYANIDLHGGDEKDRKKCKKMIREFFPNADINISKANSFCTAVKFLWKQPKSKFFLHLEDDWEALRPLRISSNIFTESNKVKQWLLVKPRFEQSWPTNIRYRPRPNIPFYFPDFQRPAFSTSPSFINSSFARDVSQLLNWELNPEKQMFNSLNLDLEEYLSQYRSKVLVSWWQPRLIEDIGRLWQQSNGLRVEIVNGIHTYRKIETS